ncbi:MULTISPECIES: DUF6879 family protein [Actinoplanes]|uniref:DUF6879 family protein n=1 Tax=Actinoplanes TaxID=1865 RepID=UPI0005F2ABBF|nr:MULTISPECIES: DUF6879 family protein [Actinoplanes]GLX99866.1 hypothetical protein Acsp01_02460 [Actinoplanes sp. NBRC 101535]
MRLMQVDAFRHLFRDVRRSAFHLEVSDVYDTPEENEPFRRFLAGEPDDFGWQRSWLDLIRRTTAAGCVVERLRVVTVPHGDYTRWLLSLSGLNVAAGERIRWLPRDEVGGLPVSTDDFWVFDDRRVVYTLVDQDGTFAGGAETDDPATVARCLLIRDMLWPVAIPHDVYTKS